MGETMKIELELYCFVKKQQAAKITNQILEDFEGVAKSAKVGE